MVLLKSTLACIRFLITNAIRFDCDASVFGVELQQLGLQKENSNAICKVMVDYKEKLRQHLRENTLRGIIFLLW